MDEKRGGLETKMARNGLRCLFDYCKQFENFKSPSLTRHIFSRTRFNNKFPYSRFLFIEHLNPKFRSLASGRNQSTLESIPKHGPGCPICNQNLTFTYKDVLLLSQFVSPEGNILNRRITGVCRKQQRKLEKAIEISRRLGLIPRKPPALVEQQRKS